MTIKLNHFLLLFVMLQSLGLCLMAQQFPHISGTIKISVKTGMIEADLMMSDLPHIKGYSIWLNSGFNIDYIRDSTDKITYSYDRYYNGEKAYEDMQYYLPASDQKSRFLPKKICIKYVGAFPVKSDTSKYTDLGDWKGNIAFNGKYVRLTEQSGWYPILYDTLKDVVYNKVTYDLKIITDDSKTIYLNGSPPLMATTASFKSEVAVPLLLYAGDLDFNKKNKTYFINTFLNDQQEDILSNWTDKITNFYAKKLEIPYGSDITYAAEVPVSRRNAWMFVSYPTVTFMGKPGWYDLKSYFDDTKQQLKDSSLVSFLSHELGHYYFGTYFVPNAELKWMFLEGITEYISLQARKQILGPKYYTKSLNSYVNQIKNFNVVALSDVKTEGEINNTYRYQYMPLFLTALEKNIGQQTMWKWLNIVLTSHDQSSNYGFFRSTLLQSGVSQKQFDLFEGHYIKSSNAKQNVINSIIY